MVEIFYNMSMEISIILFVIGFILGGIAVYIPQMLTKKQLTEQMNLHFENTANRVFRESASSLTELNRENLEDFYKKFKEKIEDLQKVESEHFTGFDRNIKNFLEAGNKISQDAAALVNVMKSDNRTQGHWGEIVLEKVLESSGLRKGEEYTVQEGTSEGRPDATVYLPDSRCVFIDAKTSFASWDGYVNATDENEKETYLAEFINSTKNHIKGLAGRKYSNDEKSSEIVLMFIPIEGCYSLMFCENCNLWNFAWKNNIMPVSPSTLLAALKIINAFYVTDKKNKNAEEMARLCIGIHDKFASLLEELLKIRTILDTLIKKLDGKGNILGQIKKLEPLCGNTTKELVQITQSSDDGEN